LLGVFQEKNAKTPPKFPCPYKKILKPLPQKISGYAPDSRAVTKNLKDKI